VGNFLKQSFFGLLLNSGCLFLLLIINGITVAQTKDLGYYIDVAIKNSPLIKDIQNKVASNKIDIDRVKLSYGPQVYGTSNNTIAPVIGGIGYDAALTNIASFNELVNVSKNFASKGNLNTQYNAINLLNDSFLSVRKMSEQDLKRTITAQYITTYGDQQQMVFYTSMITALKEHEHIIRNLTESNIYRQTDYLTFLVTIKQQELQLKQLSIQAENDLAILNYLCGIFDTTNFNLNTPATNVQELPDANSSVFFLHYKTDSITLRNELSLLNYSYKPKVNAFANAGFSSSLQYDAYKNFGYSFGINVAVPIYDGHQKKLLEKKLDLAINTVSNYRDFFSVQYTQEISRLKRQLSSTEALIDDINEQIKYSQALIDVNRKLLGTGDAKIADFVIAINNYLAAKNLLTQNNLSRMQIINQINYWNK